MAFLMQEKGKLQGNYSPKNPLTSRDIELPYSSNIKYRKKRIGPYSYYRHDLIGYGASSYVYRCIYKDDKSRVFAVKVMELRKMNSARYKLLQNEIKILRNLEHPNILKLHDVYFTENNCYLITDLCEGGTLQSYLQKYTGAMEDRENHFKPILQQIIEGCKYLAQQMIIHRDIKPANIFLQNGTWKIGDFGFSRTIIHPSELVHEKYNVGSPLFMPPQALEKNMYSLKTDAFALGVLLFNLFTKEFPWNGKNKKQLLNHYSIYPFPEQKIRHISEEMQVLIKGLCSMENRERFCVTDFDRRGKNEEVEKTLASSERTLEIENFFDDESSITETMRELKLKISQQLKLCLFILYIDKNIQTFSEFFGMSSILKRHLKYLVKVFNWNENSNMQRYIQDFQCSHEKELQFKGQYYSLQFTLNKYIMQLDQTSINKCKVLRYKLCQYESLVHCLLSANHETFKEQLSLIILHPDFSRIYLCEDELKKVESSTIINHSF